MRDPYILVEEPDGNRHDFSKMPALQSPYMTHSAHITNKTIAELRKNVSGFLVEMPLDWGVSEKKSPKPPLGDKHLIAMNQSYRTKTMG